MEDRLKIAKEYNDILNNAIEKFNNILQESLNSIPSVKEINDIIQKNENENQLLKYNYNSRYYEELFANTIVSRNDIIRLINEIKLRAIMNDDNYIDSYSYYSQINCDSMFIYKIFDTFIELGYDVKVIEASGYKPLYWKISW